MVDADILLGYRIDHSLPKQRGPSFWKLNTHLLSEEYKDQNNVDAVLLWNVTKERDPKFFFFLNSIFIQGHPI